MFNLIFQESLARKRWKETKRRRIKKKSQNLARHGSFHIRHAPCLTQKRQRDSHDLKKLLKTCFVDHGLCPKGTMLRLATRPSEKTKVSRNINMRKYMTWGVPYMTHPTPYLIPVIDKSFLHYFNLLNSFFICHSTFLSFVIISSL